MGDSGTLTGTIEWGSLEEGVTVTEFGTPDWKLILLRVRSISTVSRIIRVEGAQGTVGVGIGSRETQNIFQRFMEVEWGGEEMRVELQILVPVWKSFLQGLRDSDVEEGKALFIETKERLSKVSKTIAMVGNEEDECVVGSRLGIMDGVLQKGTERLVGRLRINVGKLFKVTLAHVIYVIFKETLFPNLNLTKGVTRVA